jgi:hypothetical protein
MSDDLVKQSITELQDLVRCRCHPAYTGRGLHDPDCDCDSADAVQVVADRIEELEAKLAKAVGALEFYRSAINLRIDCEITYAMQEAHDNAETFLAELKGRIGDE